MAVLFDPRKMLAQTKIKVMKVMSFYFRFAGSLTAIAGVFKNRDKYRKARNVFLVFKVSSHPIVQPLKLGTLQLQNARNSFSGARSHREFSLRFFETLL